MVGLLFYPKLWHNTNYTLAKQRILFFAVRISSERQSQWIHATQTRLSYLFKKKKDALKRLHLEWQGI